MRFILNALGGKMASLDMKEVDEAAITRVIIRKAADELRNGRIRCCNSWSRPNGIDRSIRDSTQLGWPWRLYIRRREWDRSSVACSSLAGGLPNSWPKTLRVRSWTHLRLIECNQNQNNGPKCTESHVITFDT